MCDGLYHLYASSTDDWQDFILLMIDKTISFFNLHKKNYE